VTEIKSLLFCSFRVFFLHLCVRSNQIPAPHFTPDTPIRISTDHVRSFDGLEGPFNVFCCLIDCSLSLSLSLSCDAFKRRMHTTRAKPFAWRKFHFHSIRQHLHCCGRRDGFLDWNKKPLKPLRCLNRLDRRFHYCDHSHR